MKRIRALLGMPQKFERKSPMDYQREMMVKLGREQFKKLVDQGLAVPVGLL